MLHELKAVQKYKIVAMDGEIGSVADFLFDDVEWKVRYLVAETGSWFHHKKVLITPESFGYAEKIEKEFHVMLTCEQIKNSPPLSNDYRVSRHYEHDLHRYYGWSPYWLATTYPGLGMPAVDNPPDEMPPPEEGSAGAQRLRSAKELDAYHVRAVDGEIGHVENFLMDNANWKIRYLVIDTKNWSTGKKTLVLPQWIKDVSTSDREICVNVPRGIIQNSPEYDPNVHAFESYEEQLRVHYEKSKYWVY